MDEKDLEKREKRQPPQPEGQMVWVPPGYDLVAEPPAQEHGPHLWDYIWLIWRRRWLVALAFIFCAGLATIVSLRTPPIYEAVAKLRIEPETPKILGFNDLAVAEVNDWKVSFIETQRQIIQNRTLAKEVVEQLNLFAAKGDNEAGSKTTPSLFSGFAAYLKSFRSAPKSALPQDRAEEEAADMRSRIDAFLDGLTVTPVRETQIVEVRFLSDSRKTCAGAANALCEAFIRYNYKSKLDAFGPAQEWIKQKVEEIKGKLEQSEEALYKFAGGKDILPTTEAKDGSPKQPEVAQLEETGLKLAEAERQLFEKEFQLRSLETSTSPGAFLLAEPRVQKLLESLAELQVRYDQTQQQLGPAMGEMKGLAAAKNRLESQLVEERQRALEHAGLEQKQAKSTFDFLKSSYEKQRKNITDMQQRFIQYNILKREADVYRELYNSLLQRGKEIGVSSGLKAGNVSIIEPAEPPAGAKYPNKKRNVLLGGFLGLLLGVGLAFFLDYMDTTIQGPDDVERVAQLAALGFVPHLDPGRRRTEPVLPVELITHERPKSAFAENIRYLRTSVLYSLPGRSPKTLLVTSSLPGEGKTTVAINLAIAFAQRGQRVLLVDADLKRPAVHKFFEVDRNKGLTEILTGKLNGECISASHIPNLFLLPSGSKAPNPVDLLDSDVMRDLLASLADTYDHIIIDSAPMIDMADTSVLVPYVDGVMLVVRPGKTPRAALRRIKEKLTGLQGRVLGVVLNNPRKRPGGRPYGYGYGYGYGYADGYGYGYAGSYGHEHPYGEDAENPDPEDHEQLADETASGTALPSPDEDREV